MICDRAVASVPRTCTAFANRFSWTDVARLVRSGERSSIGVASPGSQGVTGEGVLEIGELMKM